MKHRTIGLTAALFAALIGTAFLFTACWQGNPAGGSGSDIVIPGGGGSGGNGGSGGGNSGGGNGGSGGGNISTSAVEGTWKGTGSAGSITLQLLKGGNANVILATGGSPASDSGTYTITGNTITFTGFGAPIGALFNREFGYKIEGNTLTLSEKTMGTTIYQFKKA